MERILHEPTCLSESRTVLYNLDSDPRTPPIRPRKVWPSRRSFHKQGTAKRDGQDTQECVPAFGGKQLTGANSGVVRTEICTLTKIASRIKRPPDSPAQTVVPASPESRNESGVHAWNREIKIACTCGPAGLEWPPSTNRGMSRASAIDGGVRISLGMRTAVRV